LKESTRAEGKLLAFRGIPFVTEANPPSGRGKEGECLKDVERKGREIKKVYQPLRKGKISSNEKGIKGRLQKGKRVHSEWDQGHEASQGGFGWGRVGFFGANIRGRAKKIRDYA